VSGVLQVVSCGGPAWWVGPAAPFAAARGRPPGGPLDPGAQAAGAAALGGGPGDDALTIEHVGGLTVSAGDAPLWLAQVGRETVELWRLRAGESLSLPGPRAGRVGTLVVAARPAAPVGPGPLLPLARGAWLPGTPWRGPAAPAATRPRPAAAGPLRVVPVPDAGLAAVAALGAGVWSVGAAADRRGVPLRGPGVAGVTAVGRSRPVVPGAIQALPDGGLVVLGPDGPTLGGYPLVGVVVAADRGRVWNAGPDEALHFRVAGP